MKDPILLTEINSSFSLKTNDYKLNVVTQALGIKPDNGFEKGDTVRSQYSDQIAINSYGLWKLEFKTINEDPNISEHISYYYDLLSDKLELLENLKDKYNFTINFYIHLITEHPGEEIQLSSKELSFISKIADQFILFFNVTDKIIFKH